MRNQTTISVDDKIKQLEMVELQLIEKLGKTQNT